MKMSWVVHKKRLLMVCISLCAGMSTVLLIMSVSSEHWLHTKERLPESYPYTDTPFIDSNNETVTELYISTNYGLWRVCTYLIGADDKAYTAPTCNSKNQQLIGTVDEELGEDTIMSVIMKDSKKTAIFPILSIFLEVLGDMCCVLAYCCGKKRYLIFITGCLYVASGMSLLVGSVLFMGAVTGTANHQPHVPKGDLPAFRYYYASSFFMVTIAFCLDEISGVLCVYLFIIRHKETVKRRHARLTVHKSKAARLHHYVRRQSRIQSLSSACGDASRRSSHNPETMAQLPGCSALARDISHMTMLTVVESHNNLKGACNLLPSNGVPVEPQPDENNVHVHVHHEMTKPYDALPPPKEFQSSTSLELSALCRENHQGINNIVSCKTTAV